MNIRRDRVHQMGLSNLAIKTNTSQEIRSNHSLFTSPEKKKNIGEIIGTRASRAFNSPLAKTQEIYENTGRLVRSKTLVGYPRLAQLEEKEKRKLAFTGESVLLFDKHLEKYRDQDITLEEIESEKKANLVKNKHNVHGTAIQETQLVGFDKHSADTLKNNVNLEKVREARRVLRRRYASRKNLHNIYTAWDEDHTGTISIENVYNMCKKMGLNLNVDEARVLLASANKTGTGELMLDEFLDLIYNKDDILNVDLDHLAKNLGKDYLLKKEELEKEDDNLLRKLEEDAKHTREIKHLNQTNLILKNRLNEINLNFLEADPLRVGYVNLEKFEEVLKKLGISEGVVSEKDIKTLFDKHKTDHIINYKNFIESLRQFSFHYEDAYKEQEIPSRLRDQTERSSTIGFLNAPEEFNIVDCRNIPPHTMMRYLERTDKVNRAIKRLFPTQEDFCSYLSEVLHLKKDHIKEKYVNKKELKNIIKGLFDNFDEVEVGKKEFEAFLSSCLYNKQNDTNLAEVTKLIYEENENGFIEKVTFKKKGPGPRKEVAEAEINEEEGHKLQKGYSTPQLASPVNQLQSKDEKLNKLLQKIDDTFFVGSKKALEVFNTFDVDKDGYISRKDFMKKLEDMAIMSKQEAYKVLDYIDPENKGFVNFQEFSKRIRPNMAQQNEKGEFLVLPFVSPSKEAFEKTSNIVPEAKLKIKNLLASSRLDGSIRNTIIEVPCWRNTFLNIQPNSNSPMFATEAERFDRSPLNRIKFQSEEKIKKKQILEARLKNKQMFASIINERINQESVVFEQLDKCRRAKKFFEQTQYEKRAKLTNSYV